MKTLLLVDGSSYLYRAFHALPDLRNRNNEPTGAIHGVLNMLRRLHKDFQADYSACVFDAKGKTFRDALYPDYKAHRPSMPSDLACQIEPLHACIRAMGWPMLIIDGVEADDVIGTLAKQAVDADMRCIISTGDKDIAQLVNPHVTLVNTMTNDVLDEANVLAKFGVPPALMLDYLMLVGDASDNVPGVDKVGPKTAVKLLTQYGSLQNIIVHAHEIKGAIGDNMRKALAWFDTSRQLITIKCDVDLPIKVTDLISQPQDIEQLIRLYEQLDMKASLRELRQQMDERQSELFAAGKISGIELQVGHSPAVHAGIYQAILTEAEWSEWLLRLEAASLVSIDCETTSLNPMQAKLVGISFCIDSPHAVYVPLAHHYAGAPQQLSMDSVLSTLKPWLENAAKPKVGQNLKYDKHVLANHGLELNGIAHDTLLQSYVLESHRPHNMDNLAMRHLDIKTISYDEVTGKGASRIGFDQVAIDIATEYAAEDADITLRLHQVLYPGIQQEERLNYIYREIEMPVLDVLYEIERNGVLLDAQLLQRQSHELGKRLCDLEQQAHLLAGQPFNLNSPKQIQEVLFDRLKLPVIKKTPTGVPSTDEDVLQRLALDYPLPKLLLDYRSLAKLKSTYTDKLPLMIDPNTGRVHTNYAQAVAVTGRLASSEPNLQNIPIRTSEGRRIREAFIAPPGHRIVSADYSQIELRIMAHISQDDGLLKAFAAGEDIHRTTAAEIFGIPLGQVDPEQRRYAKVINFGLIYGMSEFGLAAQLGIERSAARAYMERYFARYPGVERYMQQTREKAKRLGYVETVLGRRLWLPEINSPNGNRQQGAERAAINAPMQGTAADIIKLAMIAVRDWLHNEKLRSKLIMQVHDELVLEVPDDEVALIKDALPQYMGHVLPLDVPLLIEVGSGDNWDQAH
ncbi:DNA polymerase I [Nitrosomonas sp. JL21]|uniref:DNA polymerase I n=1 Tax=Nitrosomonas sp. JL21 TaxID=153949 RepID=UPI00136F6FAD|nr:DNA polymerase I [Nitrosomonas sp. JL21]MBL8497542.1 DNA polymerase I [Nitrosomonas sp.]MCC7092166.1 DNA polymerase I [Nitrosomonas sp.]MXS78633.1 DNA polymerase I [Nitrosomonas sp. JL21]